MALTVKQLRNTHSDADLLKLLQIELNSVFPIDSRRDLLVQLSRLQNAPRGMRAMASTFELDVSMALDDLAWHFVNHQDIELYEETREGLRELEAVEAAEIFEKAFAVVEPYWTELGSMARGEDSGATHAWLNATGIQNLIDPLNARMWNLLGQWPNEGLMHYWVAYARKHPGFCVVAN